MQIFQIYVGRKLPRSHPTYCRFRLNGGALVVWPGVLWPEKSWLIKLLCTSLHKKNIFNISCQQFVFIVSIRT